MRRDMQASVVGAALAICGLCGSCGTPTGDSCEARLPATVSLPEPDTASEEPCRMDLNLEVSSFPDYASALCQWREGLKNETCGGGEGRSVRTAAAGECDSGRRMFINVQYQDSRVTQFYDAETGNFLALESGRDDCNSICGCAQYWPISINCDDRIVTEECVAELSNGPDCFTDSDCDDGLFCTGAEACNDGICVSDPAPCGFSTAPADDADCELCDEVNDGCFTSCDSDAECDDGIFCNGQETCNGCRCQPGVPPCQACDIVADRCI